MKKLLLTNLFVAIFISVVLLLTPWNINSAESGCTGIKPNNFCNNSVKIIQGHVNEKIVQEIASAVFPYDDLIIKI